MRHDDLSALVVAQVDDHNSHKMTLTRRYRAQSQALRREALLEASLGVLSDLEDRRKPKETRIDSPTSSLEAYSRI